MCDLGVQVPGLAAIVAGEVNLRANLPTWTKINGRCREVAVTSCSTVLTTLFASGILSNLRGLNTFIQICRREGASESQW